VTRPAFRRGLADLGNGLYAWLQPDGGWGWSNAGLVVDGDQSLLVDTLFDEPLTAEMLRAMRSATGIAPEAIGTLVNTHANGDHTHGNALVPNAEVVATAAAAREMAELPPALVAQLMAGAKAGQLGDAGEMLAEVFAPFDLASARGRAPTRTFDDQLVLRVGDREVVLKKLGPAHTAGDLAVHVPGDRAVFTGDILFAGVTPIIWAGPVGNWLAACDWILGLDVETIVPGHGP
jgi:glyoxylase-like metal-dependent hydrolase (beta-lactamase superfamily II)